jgi:hypothetical protein
LADETKLYAAVTYTANGTQTVYSFNFDYLRPTFIHATVDGVAVSDFTINQRTLEFTTAPKGTLKIYRKTPTDQLVAWADASILRASDMTIQQIQTLHILEELMDSVVDTSLFEPLKIQFNNILEEIKTYDAEVKADSITVIDLKTQLDKDMADLTTVLTNTKAVAQQALDIAPVITNANAEAKEAASSASIAASKCESILSNNVKVYDSTVTYNPPDVVMTPNGNTYRCIKTSVGNSPETSTGYFAQTSATVLQTFEYDEDGDLQPKEIPAQSSV